MKAKRIILVAVVMLSVFGITIYSHFSNKKEDSSEVSSFFREKVTKYDLPVISSVSYLNHQLTIEGGIFSLGDITMDGVINNDDINFIKELLNGTLEFTESQINISDFNQDGEVNENDIYELQDYIKENSTNNKKIENQDLLDELEVKYDIDLDSMLFCVTNEQTSDNCNWQKSGTYSIAKDKDYYIFMKDEMTDKITSPYILTVDDMNETDSYGLNEAEEIEETVEEN